MVGSENVLLLLKIILLMENPGDVGQGKWLKCVLHKGGDDPGQEHVENAL